MAAENYFMCCDQDVLNIVFKGDIFYLPVKWNLSVTDEDYIDLSEDEKYEYPEARENPAILHFYADKPLEAREEGEEEQTERHKLFWDYASRTPFYESLQNKLAANKEKRRAGETIDPEREDCVLFSNNKIEAKSAEVALEKHGIAYKIKYGDADSAYKFFVANEDVEQALDVLMSAL
jgi:lipopolysaccharide biosynthesis glycosyltransferase